MKLMATQFLLYICLGVDARTLNNTECLDGLNYSGVRTKKKKY